HCLRRPEPGSREEVAATLIAHIPRIERAHPCIGLALGDLPGIVDDGGKDTRLVNAALPEIEGEPVIAAIPAGDLPKLDHGYPQRIRRVDPEAGHALAVHLPADRPEMRQHLISGCQALRRG